MTWLRATLFVPLLLAALLQGAAAAVRVEVTPSYPVVTREGESVTVLCRAGRPLQYCRIEQVSLPESAPSGRRTSWNLTPAVPVADGVVYSGEGLESGQCGFTVQRVQRSFNGVYRCTMGFTGTADEGIGSFNITVAVAPSSPELTVNPPSQNLQRPSSGGFDDRYSGRYSGSTSSGRNEFQDGDTLSAMCTVRDGRPAANLSWFLDEQEITRGLSTPNIVSTRDDLYTIHQNLSQQLTWRDHGKSLRCVADHIALGGRNNQTSYSVAVRFKPRPQSSPMEQFGFIVGVPGDIVVPINANPKPSVTWRIDSEVVQENSQDSTGRFHATNLLNNGSGMWTAVLKIQEAVTMQDIEREYTLEARNEVGTESYRIRLSTSSEPQVMSLEAGAIIGIVVAILVLLLAIFLLVFARTTGRWCFAGGVSRQDPKESSDTESADHGPTHNSKKPKAKFTYMFKKKGDKVGDDAATAKEVESPVPQRPAQLQQQQQQSIKPPGSDTIVYAELDLKDLGDRRPQVRPDEERTEYAEILYTAKPASGPEHTSPPQP